MLDAALVCSGNYFDIFGSTMRDLPPFKRLFADSMGHQVFRSTSDAQARRNTCPSKFFPFLVTAPVCQPEISRSPVLSRDFGNLLHAVTGAGTPYPSLPPLKDVPFGPFTPLGFRIQIPGRVLFNHGKLSSILYGLEPPHSLSACCQGNFAFEAIFSPSFFGLLEKFTPLMVDKEDLMRIQFSF